MSSIGKNSQTNIQAKIFDFALMELVRSKRSTFQPIWTLDSWAKFMIWMSLNCGLSGNRESFQFFADALGNPLTSRIRKVFFERTLEKFCLYIFADPSEDRVLVMPLNREDSISKDQILLGLNEIGLNTRVSLDFDLWKSHDALIAIPWESLENVI